MKSLKEAMLIIFGLDYTAMGVVAAEFAKEKFDSEILCKRILERKKSY